MTAGYCNGFSTPDNDQQKGYFLQTTQYVLLIGTQMIEVVTVVQ